LLAIQCPDLRDMLGPVEHRQEPLRRLFHQANAVPRMPFGI
jgi:hypothetical protein